MIFKKYITSLLLATIALAFISPGNVYAHCKWYHPHHCGQILYENGKKVYKIGEKVYRVGKPIYDKGKTIAQPVYDLYTGDYIGFIDSSGNLIKSI